MGKHRHNDFEVETRWSVTEISQATGLSEGVVGSYFCNKRISTKNGLTFLQILQMLNSERRNHGVNNPEKIELLIKLLEAVGKHTRCSHCYRTEE